MSSHVYDHYLHLCNLTAYNSVRQVMYR